MQDIQDISIRNLGPIKHADIELGDLTVLVGQQATGKSIFLQTLKLLIDRDHINAKFAANNMDFKFKPEAFLDGYYGNNMSSLWKNDQSKITISKQEIDFYEQYARPSLGVKSKSRTKRIRTGESLDLPSSVFYIPAQRVISLPHGVTQHFGQYNFGDPFVLRVFSDFLHNFLQSILSNTSDLSPQTILPDTLGKPITEQIYAGANLVLHTDPRDYVRKLALNLPDGTEGLPFLTWSAGQREFTPLMLGLYPFFTEADMHPYIIIEEPEMGLHPQAINVTLYIVLNLLARGHKVLISSHSPQVLDMIWALNICQQKSGTPEDVLNIFGLSHETADTSIAEAALTKKYKVHYFQHSGTTEDISTLDPGSDDLSVANWGGLTEFASIAGDVVSQVVNRDYAMSDE